MFIPVGVARIADRRYEAGLGSFVERDQAETARLDARTRLENLKYDRVIAWSTLEVVQGRPIPDLVSRLASPSSGTDPGAAP